MDILEGLLMFSDKLVGDIMSQVRSYYEMLVSMSDADRQTNRQIIYCMWLKDVTILIVQMSDAQICTGEKHAVESQLTHGNTIHRAFQAIIYNCLPFHSYLLAVSHPSTKMWPTLLHLKVVNEFRLSWAIESKVHHTNSCHQWFWQDALLRLRCIVRSVLIQTQY